jgi:CubicO group peptidase (beta-lactamase class C family)
MISLICALPILIGLPQSPTEPDSLARDRVSGTLGVRLDSQLTQFAAYGFSGTVLVVRSGQVVLLKGYGLANVERGIPNTAETRFEMNSMTKMFTGVAVLQLAAEGRVRLSDSVERHLGAFPPGKRGATIQQLATHTSGLIVEGSDLAGDSRDAFVRDVKRTPRESAPGERYRYTNAGFSLLAAIIETVSGESYEDYVRRHEFAPAGLRTASFRNEVPTNDPRFAHGYVGTPAALEPGPPNPYVWGTRGAGGVWATVGDMYRWLVALEKREILADAQWRLLITPPVPPAQEAFGWHVETTPEGRLRIQKGGGSDDFASHVLYYPHEQVVIVWASNNLRQRWRRMLNEGLPAVVFGDDSFSLPPVVPISREALEEREGRYFVGQDILELRSGIGYLYAAGNRLDVPTTVMFFPQDSSSFTAFDPASRAVTRLEFGRDERRSAAIEFQDGRRVLLRRREDELR